MYFNSGEYLPDSLNYASMNYGYTNLENSRFFPSTYHVESKLLAYNFRYLFQRAVSVFEWTIPKSVESNYFKYVLYTIGFGFIFNTEDYGTIFNHGTLSGYDIYYQPAFAVVANPLLNKNPERYAKMRIGKDCSIIRLTPDYLGIADICRYYAELLAEAGSSLKTNLVNTKFAYIFGANNKNTAESLKKLYDNVASGETAVFADKKLYDENGNLSVTMLNSAVKNVYIGDQLIQDIRGIINDFDSCIGIPNGNINKKERMVVDEANMNNFETKALCYIWLDTLKKDIEKSNSMFPEFRFNVNFRKEVLENGKTGNDNAADNV